MASGDNEPKEMLSVEFPDEVIRAIQEIIPSDDPFDSPNFNAVEYINSRFPSEQSLHHIDSVLEEMRTKITSVDDDIQKVIRMLINSGEDGHSSLFQAQTSISELSSRFQDIKVKAGESEQRVKEITRDIKQLDIAKRNLTTSITTLNHLQMLVEGVEKLSILKNKHEYAEIATLLQGVVKVLDHLSRYKHIPQIADLSKQVEQLKTDLEKQILSDFHTAFHGPNAKRFAPVKELAEACLVVSVLDSKVKKTIIEDVIKTQLAEYEVLFAGSESDAWLTKVDLRRKWFLKTAIEFEKTLASMFPQFWNVPAHLALSFCELTSSQLARAMELRSADINVSILLHAHKVMSELEHLLDKKYTTFRLDSINSGQYSTKNPFEEETESINPFTETGSDEANSSTLTQSPFTGAICKCYLPYLKVYLDSVDRKLSEQIDKFSQEIKQYKFEHIDAEESNVVPYCGELFTVYKDVLVEYLRLNSNGDLISLSEIFQRHLKEFGSKVLRAALPKVGANIPMPKDLNMKELTAVLAQVQTLWKENEQTKLTENDIRRVCSVLVSAEYCEEMTNRLELKIKEKSPAASVSFITFSHEQELFHTVLTQCIALLVTHNECQCENALGTMVRMSWVLEQTGDQSAYINVIAHNLSSSVPLIRHNLHTSRKYFTRFCDKLAASIIQKFIQQIYRCRPINSIGCEQLLLDSHAIKAVLLQMPVIGSQVKRDPPIAYTRMVTRGISRAELVLQVVMGEYASHRELVEKFIRLLPEATIADFQKVLEMRAVKDRTSVLELYRQLTLTSGDAVQGSAPSDSQSLIGNIPSPSTPEHEISKIARLERMLKSRRLIS